MGSERTSTPEPPSPPPKIPPAPQNKPPPAALATPATPGRGGAGVGAAFDLKNLDADDVVNDPHEL